MTLTIKDSPEIAGTLKSGQKTENIPGQSPRSNPVCLEVPVVVRSLPGENGNEPGAAGPTRQEGRTVIVFDNGGVLRLANPLPPGQKVILTNQQGRDVVGRVVGGRNLPAIKGYIEVEFIEPVSDFWRIHQTLEVNHASGIETTAVVLPEASKAEPLLAPVTLSRPVVTAKEILAHSGGAPTFEDIDGLVDGPLEDVSPSDESLPDASPLIAPRANKIEPPAYSSHTPVIDALAENPVDASKRPPAIAPESRLSELPIAKAASLPPQSIGSAAVAKPQLPHDVLGRVGQFSTPDPGSFSSKPGKRTPLLLGGAALVLAALGAGYFFMHRGISPAPAPAVVAAVASQPAAPPADASAAPVTASAPEPAVEQAPPQAAQPIPAVVSAPVELPTPTLAASSNSRQHANTAIAKQQDRPAPSRQPLVNLKMSTPVGHGQNSANAPEGSSIAAVDMTSSLTPGVASPGNFGARTDRQPAPPSAPPEAIAASPAAKVVQEAKLIASTRPVYPALAKQSGVQGRVALILSIDEKGAVVSAKALSGPYPIRQAALDSVKNWKYSPALIDGKPASSQLSVTIDFRLN